MAHYSSREYWEKRYAIQGDQTFDWYMPFEAFREDLKKGVSVGRALILGSGLSETPEKLYDEGYNDVVAVDWSQRAITTMQKREEKKKDKQRPGLVYSVVDITQPMDFEKGSFALVFDKAVIDALLCGVDDVEKRDVVATVMKNVYTLLKPGGVFCHITHCSSHDGVRGVLFDNPNLPWSDIAVVRLAKPESALGYLELREADQYYYMYMFTK